MPVSLCRLRIAGFKSFAEPATLEILPGLTGIVGPNGCGKSNVVEALRWAMGESSARSLRGSEMDDVIFAGTTGRPSRNLAEVTVGLADTKGLAPPPFQDAPELDVTRRIERGVGSHFRVNGRETRARDVQTLFADLATGARASAMVSQGRIGALVAARPEERRAILEEAAGITGLHARRHEAELKLRGAEANLERAEDARTRLAAQLEGLRRQAKQAARFRDIGAFIRRAEAELLAIQRAVAERARAAAQATLSEAGESVALALAASTETTARAANAASELPALRAAESEARTRLERARLTAEQVRAETERAVAALDAAARRAAQADRDLHHADQTARDAQAALDRLKAEQDTLHRQAEAAPDPQGLDQAAESAAAALRAAEAAADQAGERAGGLIASQRAAQDALTAAQNRARRASENSDRLQAERERVRAQGVDAHALRASAMAAEQARAHVTQARLEHDAAEQACGEAQRRAATVRERAAAAQTERGRLHAAVNGLEEALGASDPVRQRIVDQIAVPEGLEAALGSALGEDLEVSADPAEAHHWRDLPMWDATAALPAGAVPFAAQMQGPAALGRAFSQIGLIDSAATGEALQPALLPGQTLATAAGEMFRWDGLRIRAGATSRATVRLRQRNRLASLRRELERAEAAAQAAAAVHAEAEETQRLALAAEHRTRAGARAADQAAQQARDHHAALAERTARSATRLAGADLSCSHAEAERAEAEAAVYAARAAWEALPDAGTARTEWEQARTVLGRLRVEAVAAQSTRDAQRAAAQARAARLDTLCNEIADWRNRDADARGRLSDLQQRAAEAHAEAETLRPEPQRLATLAAEALDGVQAAEDVRGRAAQAVQSAETVSRDAERAARQAESALAASREAKLRAEAEASRADAAWGVVAERIVERLGASPALPDPPAVLEADTEERSRRRLEKLQREREGIGPVNMRAEIEAAEIETQAETIAREGAELATAIAKLRGSIGHINREGRERLGQIFADIDRNFRALFETMFGGGRAHLAMVGSDDPLLAGLEIYAQPPGKRLATLSLLSGGEQALTALSLIFAVFRCNPAPVCVLDEVDAPLDDANVERFCDLVRTMVRDTGTRFLIVTHHQLTMSRMDRLYGVTMQERGVSHLLSVDLSHAVALAEQVPIAAE